MYWKDVKEDVMDFVSYYPYDMKKDFLDLGDKDDPVLALSYGDNFWKILIKIKEKDNTNPIIDILKRANPEMFARFALLDFEGVDLRDAYLRNANMKGANLKNVDMRNLDLYHINFEDADLCGANLQDAKLLYSNLKNANFNGANLNGVDLRGANLYNAKLNVKENLDLSYSRICKLPDDLRVNDLEILETEIKNIPDTVKINGDLDIRYSMIKKLPDNFTIGGDLAMDNMRKFPENLTVCGSLYYKSSRAKKFPDSLTVKGKIHRRTNQDEF